MLWQQARSHDRTTQLFSPTVMSASQEPGRLVEGLALRKQEPAQMMDKYARVVHCSED
jgi:hypothetical protein